VVEVHLVREAFNKVAVKIPRLLTQTIARWEVTVEKLTNSNNLPHETLPKKTFRAERSGSLFRFPVSFQAGCTYRVELRGFRDAECTCKVKAKRKKSSGCTCQKKSSDDKIDPDVKAHTTFRAGNDI